MMMERFPNRLKTHRLSRQWSQAELAQRAGISRTAVSAIELDRLVPSVTAALALAGVLDCSVEYLFAQPAADAPKDASWAWPPSHDSCRFWHARVGARTLLYPVETTAAGVVEHDGVYENGVLRTRSRFSPEQTLVLACCDPAAGLLAGEFNRLKGLRIIILPRSSQQALTLLAEGLIHVAGIHLSTREMPNANGQAAEDHIGGGCRLLRVARWQEGIALAPGSRIRTVQAALQSKKLRWVGREEGSGARRCLDELLDQRPPPRRLALDHRSVAEAVRCGWGDAGVCLQLVSEEAGLRFLAVREELYELCFAREAESDPRIRALTDTVRSSSYRELLEDLPGYDAAECGEMLTVA
jgi:molybdate-binding protein/transcriptional regulator with XRE-family HTH domain